jgi:hypothetical protein
MYVISTELHRNCTGTRTSVKRQKKEKREKLKVKGNLFKPILLFSEAKEENECLISIGCFGCFINKVVINYKILIKTECVLF